MPPPKSAVLLSKVLPVTDSVLWLRMPPLTATFCGDR
jgi:hypothetical protein